VASSKKDVGSLGKNPKRLAARRLDDSHQTECRILTMCSEKLLRRASESKKKKEVTKKVGSQQGGEPKKI